MRIVHVIFGFNTGGTETMLVDILNGQCALGHKLMLAVINDSYADSVLAKVDKSVDVVLLKRKPGSHNPWPIIKLNWLINRWKADAIHLHNNTICSLIKTNKPLFLTVHALGIPLIPACRKLTELFAISQAVRNDLENRYSGTYRIKVVPNGIRFNDIASKTEYGLKSSTMRIVQVANLLPEYKGQDLLIEAVGRLKTRGIDGISIDFIGAGNALDSLKNLSESAGISDRVHFLGLKDRTYIYSHLNEYDLMCHPSRSEGFGLTVAEGIAAGLPVLVPDCDGPYEIIKKGELGYVFKKGDVSSLTDALEEIYRKYDDNAQAVAIKARAYVEDNYSLRHMVERYIEEYQTAKR